MGKKIKKNVNGGNANAHEYLKGGGVERKLGTSFEGSQNESMQNF